jgi:hypothetical protein
VRWRSCSRKPDFVTSGRAGGTRGTTFQSMCNSKHWLCHCLVTSIDPSGANCGWPKRGFERLGDAVRKAVDGNAFAVDCLPWLYSDSGVKSYNVFCVRQREDIVSNLRTGFPMPSYESVLAEASRLPVEERLRLIDELASHVPGDRPPTLSEEWASVIQRRSAELDAGSVLAEDWSVIRASLFAQHGVHDAN